MSEGNEELIASFVEEAQETLADIENDFLAIEEQADHPDHDLINKVFRGIHSMKGSAGFLGLKSIGTLAHEMENVLNLIRGQELKPTSPVVDALLRGADALRTMMGNIHSSNEFDVSGHIQLLQAAVSQDTSVQVQAAMNRDVDIALPDGRLAFVLIKEMDLVLRQKQNMHIYVAEADFFADVQARGRTPLDFIRSIHEQIELIDSYVSTAGIGDLDRDLPDSMSFLMLLGTRLNTEELADHLQLPLDRVYHIADPEQCLWEPTGPLRPEQAARQTASAGNDNPPSAPEASAETAAPANAPPAAKPPAQNTLADAAEAAETANSGDSSDSASGSQEQTSLRVNVKVLDSLMNLAGELVLGRNQLLQVAGVDDNRGIDSVAARIDQVTSE
ncbi:MAG: Hpt domain-containing protein, partial [Sedimentisphaerales bacterium]|nr:Hpt domain-containing protein [Sedimentisphaerales bacterium]